MVGVRHPASGRATLVGIWSTHNQALKPTQGFSAISSVVLPRYLAVT